MNKHDQMIKALIKLSEAVSEISHLWDGDENGYSQFDDCLEENYPFENSFFEVQHDVHTWVENAVNKLKNK